MADNVIIGSLVPKKLPWISYNPSIRNFRYVSGILSTFNLTLAHLRRQALALDEYRANFIPSVWDHHLTNSNKQNVQEVWFKGGHTDVGGGAPMPKRTAGQHEHSLLSNIPLRWMVRQCLELDTGILFDCQSLLDYRMWRVLEERPMKEAQSREDFEQELLANSAELDKVDITHETYDAMKNSLGWKMLEYWPSSKPTQTKKGLDDTYW